MTEPTAAPLYSIRGLQLIGWRDMQHALDYLFAGGEIRQGTLVAINAEKVLTSEDNPEVRALISDAEFKYADGISVVRSTVSYTHLTLPTKDTRCRSRWSPYH